MKINRILILIFIFLTANMAFAADSFHAPAPTSSLVVNVRDIGAMGDGVTDDTAAIQAAINQVGGTGGTVLVPDGTYIIDVVSNQSALTFKSNMTFQMASGAVLKLKGGNNYGAYFLLNLYHVSNVNIVGGTVDGNRAESIATGGEWGYGVAINNSDNIFVEGVTSKDNWGDGFTVWGETSASTNVNFYSVISDYNRRQGMSIIWADGLVVRDSIFKNTEGTWPMGGIDIEPELINSTYANNIQILNSQFINNFCGIEVSGPDGTLTNVTISGNAMTNNRYCAIRSLPGSKYSDFSTWTNNTFTGNADNSIVTVYVP